MERRRDRGAVRPVVALVTCLALAIGVAACGSSGAADDPPTSASAQRPDDLVAAIESALDTPTGRQVRAVLVSVADEVVVEHYRRAAPAATRNVFSVTKSIVSTLVGIAVADGLIDGPEATLATMLPAHRSEMPRGVGAVTLRQLLTMTAGLPGDGAYGPDPAALDPDWVGGILRSAPPRQPGKTFSFSYSSVTSHLLAAILEEVTDGRLLAYAQEKLFDPLGIDSRPAAELRVASDSRTVAAYEAAAFAWPTDPQGVHTGYSFVKLTPRDLLALGRLYLAEGRWNGRQLLPTGWVQEATQRQVVARGGHFDGYGFQWWTSSNGGEATFAAVGFGGQLVEVVPARGLVVVVSTDVADGTEPLETAAASALVRDVVLPGLP